MLLELLPDQHQTSSGTHKPKWRRTIPDDWRKGVTTGEYLEEVAQYTELTIDMAIEDPSRLSEIAKHLDALCHPQLVRLLAHLKSSAVVGLPAEERNPIWLGLTHLAARHRRFHDADWAMPPSVVDEIEEAAECLVPEDVVDLHRPLFDRQAFDLFDTGEGWREADEKLRAARQEAVEAIFESHGLQAVLELAKAVESPGHVGFSLGLAIGDHQDASVLPDLLGMNEQNTPQFLAGYVQSLHKQHGWEWVDGLDMSTWGKAPVGQFLALLPFCGETWKRVASRLGSDDGAYWRNVIVFGFAKDDAMSVAVENLLRHDRPNGAIECLYGQHQHGYLLDREQAVAALLSAVSETERQESINTHHAAKLIKALQDDPLTDPDDLFRVEWAYLRVLDGHHGADPKHLERRLASDAEFFCELVRRTFRPKSDDSVKETTAEEQSLAQHTHRLLSLWQTPPGLLPDGRFSPEAFATWLHSVKHECRESGHLDVALSQVGQMLIHAPPSPDGLWIHESVAEALNARDADAMRRGLYIGEINSRGAHVVNPSGASEGALAEKYRRRAEDVENHGYHRLAVTLRQLAESYDREAEQIADGHAREDE